MPAATPAAVHPPSSSHLGPAALLPCKSRLNHPNSRVQHRLTLGGGRVTRSAPERSAIARTTACEDRRWAACASLPPGPCPRCVRVVNLQLRASPATGRGPTSNTTSPYHFEGESKISRNYVRPLASTPTRSRPRGAWGRPRLVELAPLPWGQRRARVILSRRLIPHPAKALRNNRSPHALPPKCKRRLPLPPLSNWPRGSHNHSHSFDVNRFYPKTPLS